MHLVLFDRVLQRPRDLLELGSDTKANVTVAGDDERAPGTVNVKDMRTGEQKQVPRAEVAAYILGMRTSGAP